MITDNWQNENFFQSCGTSEAFKTFVSFGSRTEGSRILLPFQNLMAPQMLLISYSSCLLVEIVTENIGMKDKFLVLRLCIFGQGTQTFWISLSLRQRAT